MAVIDAPYPAYSRAERLADGVIHALGVGLAAAGLIILMAQVAGDLGLRLGLAVYGGAMLTSFAASAMYHMTPWERPRPLLRRLDHAAIYLKIAGTYTPFVVLIGTGFAWAVLGLVWALALAGAAAKLFFWRTPGRLGPALYLGLGWLSVLLAWPMVQLLPPVASALVLIGGGLYSAGVIFFSWESLRFSNAIWHGFVLAASGCFFAAISLATLAA